MTTFYSPQPEALRLAEWLEGIANSGYPSPPDSQTRLSAAELRRLHSVNADLLAALQKALDHCIWPSAAISAVYAESAAAIAKATGAAS